MITPRIRFSGGKPEMGTVIKILLGNGIPHDVGRYHALIIFGMIPEIGFEKLLQNRRALAVSRQNEGTPFIQVLKIIIKSSFGILKRQSLKSVIKAARFAADLRLMLQQKCWQIPEIRWPARHRSVRRPSSISLLSMAA